MAVHKLTKNFTFLVENEAKLTGKLLIQSGTIRPITYFAHAIAFTKGLIGHIKGVRQFTRTPSMIIVLQFQVECRPIIGALVCIGHVDVLGTSVWIQMQ